MQGLACVYAAGTCSPLDSKVGKIWRLVLFGRMTSATAYSPLVCTPLPGLPAISWYTLEEEIAEQSSLP